MISSVSTAGVLATISSIYPGDELTSSLISCANDTILMALLDAQLAAAVRYHVQYITKTTELHSIRNERIDLLRGIAIPLVLCGADGCV